MRRFQAGEKDEIGRLVHKRGGTWAFDYNPQEADDDEPGFKLDNARPSLDSCFEFRRGEGLAQIVVRTCLKPSHQLLLASPVGQQNQVDVAGITIRPKAPADLGTREPRQLPAQKRDAGGIVALHRAHA